MGQVLSNGEEDGKCLERNKNIRYDKRIVVTNVPGSDDVCTRYILAI